MWIVLTVLLTVSSETAHNVLQDSFAAGSVFVANNLWLVLAATVALAVLCLAYQTSKVGLPWGRNSACWCSSNALTLRFHLRYSVLPALLRL